MAKQRTTAEERQATRKQTVIHRRDAEANRKVLAGLLGVGILLIGLVAAGVIQELVLKPRQPVATVEGTSITSQEYAKRVRFDWFRSSEPVTDPQGSSLETLDQVISEQLIREQARQRGIVVSPEEIDETVEQFFGYQRNTPTPSPTPQVSPTPEPSPTPGGEPTATPLPTSTPVTLTSYQTALSDYLKQLDTASGMNNADFRKLVETDLLRRKLYDEVSKDVPTTEEQVRARHILIAIRTPEPPPTPLPTGQPSPTPDPSATPTPGPRTDEEALALVKEVQQRLAAGEFFEMLALEYSDDTGSATQGGDLDWFGRSQMVPEFEQAAFNLQAGQVSEPVKTSFGYHLIKVDERDPARPLDEYTLEQKKYEAFQTWLADLEGKAKIERYWSTDKVPPTPAPVRP